MLEICSMLLPRRSASLLHKNCTTPVAMRGSCLTMHTTAVTGHERPLTGALTRHSSTTSPAPCHACACLALLSPAPSTMMQTEALDASQCSALAANTCSSQTACSSDGACLTLRIFSHSKISTAKGKVPPPTSRETSPASHCYTSSSLAPSHHSSATNPNLSQPSRGALAP